MSSRHCLKSSCPRSPVNRFLAEMLGQKVIHNGAVLVSLRSSVGVDDGIDRVHQFRPVRKTELSDEEVVLHRLELAILARRHRRGVSVVDRRAAAYGYLAQKLHVRLNAALAAEIVGVFLNQFVPLSHREAPLACSK